MSHMFGVVTEIVIRMILVYLQLNWQHANTVIVKFRNEAKGTDIDNILIGSWAGVNVTLLLDGKAWNIRVGAGDRYVVARLTNGAWSFNRKTVEALFADYDHKYKSIPSYPGEEYSSQLLQNVVEGVKVTGFSIIDRLLGREISADLVYSNMVDLTKAVRELFEVEFGGTMSVKGDVSGDLYTGLNLDVITPEGLFEKIVDQHEMRRIVWKGVQTDLCRELTAVLAQYTTKLDVTP